MNKEIVTVRVLVSGVNTLDFPNKIYEQVQTWPDLHTNANRH